MFRHKAPGSLVDGLQAGHSSMALDSTANAAPKPTSTAVSPSSPIKGKSWLAGLAIGAVTAGVVASGLEPAPITGRMQLQLESPFLPSVPKLQQTYPNHMPEIDASGDLSVAGRRRRLENMGETEKSFPGYTLYQEAEQLLEVTYARLAAAVDKLASSNPELDRHLANMPNSIYLDGRENLQPHMWFTPERYATASLFFHIQAGDMLPLQSTDELLSAMCRGLAPAVLRHQREVDSWEMLNTSMLPFHVYALHVAGVRWSLALALPAALWKVASSIIHTWLRKRQEYEADEVAAIISTAAGCSPDSILTSMQRAYCAALTEPYAAAMKERGDRTKRRFLSALRQVLPSVSIPQDSVLDDATVQRLKSAIAKELPDSAGSLSQSLDFLQAADLWAIRDPVDAWTSPHAHWLDRIARIEKLLGTNDLARFAGQAVYPYNVRRAYANPSRYAAGLPVYFKPNAHTHAVLCHHRRTYFHWA